MSQNGPIRKVITIKVMFEDFLILTPAVGHPGWTFEDFQNFFSKKYDVLLSRLVNEIDLTSHIPDVFDPYNSSDKFSPNRLLLHTFFIINFKQTVEG